MNTIARANIRAYFRRYIAVIVAVTIGVGFLSAVLNFSTSSLASVKNTQGQVYSKSDVVVTARTGFVASQDGDGSAQDKQEIDKLVTGRDSVADHLRYDRGMIFNVGSSTGEDPVHLYAVEGNWDLLGFKRLEGELPNGKNIGVSRNLYDSLAKGNGGGTPDITLALEPSFVGEQSADQPAKITYKATGVFEDSRMLDAFGLPSVFLDREEAEAAGFLTITPETVYLLKLAPGSNPADIVREINDAAKAAGYEGIKAATPDELLNQSMRSFSSDIAIFTYALLAFVLLAAVVCVLVTSNTFTVILAQRTRELALLRTVGASAKQIKRMMRTEGLLIGLIGGVVGVVLGIVLIAAGGALMSWITKTTTFTFAINWWSIPAGLVLAVVMTWLASIRPAQKAARLSPIAALQPLETVTVGSRKGKVRIAIGVILILFGVAVILYGMLTPINDNFELAGMLFLMVFLGCLLAFIGLLVIGTFLVPFLVALFGKLFSRKPAGKLAGLNAVRHPARTGAVGSALLIGVTLVATCLTGMYSLKTTMESQLDEAFPVDAKITFPEDAQPNAGTVDSVSRSAGVKETALVKKADIGDEALTTYSCSSIYVGDEGELRKLIPSNVPVPGLNEYGPVNSPQNAGTLTINGTELKPVGTPSGADIPCLITTETAQKLDVKVSEQDSQIWVKLDDNANLDTVTETLATAAHVSPHDVDVVAQIKDAIGTFMLTFTYIVVGLFGVAVVIALVGVSNTLTLSIIERTRENALLRALGLTKKQLRSMLFLEAFLISGITALTAIVIGTAFGFVGASSLLRSATAADLTIPWIPLLILWFATVAITMLATLMPARHAAKVTPVEGLAIE